MLYLKSEIILRDKYLHKLILKIYSMTKSALQIARASYVPKMPAELRGNVKVVEGVATESLSDQEEIKNLFREQVAEGKPEELEVQCRFCNSKYKFTPQELLK